jgi:glycosyltransferase involved in cell wall biosynthesis
MKILMVLANEFPPDVRVENEALSLVEAGHEVHLACFTRKNAPEKEIFKGVIIHRIPISLFLYKASVAALTAPFYFSFWERFLENITEKYRIETIHIHDLPLVRVGVKLKEKHDLNLVVDLHENWPALLSVSPYTKTLLGRLLSPNFLWVRYEKAILRHADMIIVVVRESRDRLEKLGLDVSRIIVVSNTLKLDNFELPDVHPDPEYFTLYYAGGLTYHRGLQTVIEAISLVHRQIPQIRLRIAGSGKYKSRLQEMIRRHKLDSRVEFLGHLPLNGVAANLAMADAALIPHLKTAHTDSTIPHKIFQYMYANKPVIASDCIPLERIVSQTKSGVVFKSDSAADLAGKIIKLYNKEVTILPARRWVEQKYNWDKDASVLVSSYESLADNGIA